MRRAALLAAIAAMAAIAGQAAAQDRKMELGRIVFDLCPKLLDGTVPTADTAQLQAMGFTPTAPRETPDGKIPRFEKGTGTDKIVLAASAKTCSLWFGGPDNPTLAGGIVEQARAAKFSGGGPLRLGDGTMLFNFKQKGSNRSVVMFLADAGGELDFAPATTVVMMN